MSNQPGDVDVCPICGAPITRIFMEGTQKRQECEEGHQSPYEPISAQAGATARTGEASGEAHVAHANLAGSIPASSTDFPAKGVSSGAERRSASVSNPVVRAADGEISASPAHSSASAGLVWKKGLNGYSSKGYGYFRYFVSKRIDDDNRWSADRSGLLLCSGEYDPGVCRDVCEDDHAAISAAMSERKEENSKLVAFYARELTKVCHLRVEELAAKNAELSKLRGLVKRAQTGLIVCQTANTFDPNLNQDLAQAAGITGGEA